LTAQPVRTLIGADGARRKAKQPCGGKGPVRCRNCSERSSSTKESGSSTTEPQHDESESSAPSERESAGPGPAAEATIRLDKFAR
jgi:hypothetical protein